MALNIYDPKKIAFTINGTLFSDELGEEGLKIEKKEAVKARTAVSGRPLLSKIQEALHSKITLSVVRGSPLNTILEGFARRGESFSVSVVDMNNKSTDSSSEAVVTKSPDTLFKDDSDLTWELLATYITSSTVG